MLAFVLLLAAHGARVSVTPITRVVNLLKEMDTTLNAEMDEDEKLYQQLSCWCTSGMSEKENAVAEATEKITELTATRESLTAKSAELKVTIETTEKNVAANKEALETATATRKRDGDAFHNKELDQIQNLENMKAAFTVMAKHDNAAFPQVDSTSFLQVNEQTQGWSTEDMAVVRKALKSQSVFMQDSYTPAYESQSGEILGVLKQMKETMAADLAEAQKKEKLDAAAFDELRRAKMAEIEAGEKKAEDKEDVLSDTDVKNAEAAEDKDQTEKVMAEDQKFIVSLKKTCENANKNFELRKKSRLEEIKAVSETIGILTSDEARDNQRATYGGAAAFLQTRQRRALQKIRATTRLSLASRAGLDNFSAIKKVMDDMIKNMQKQQAAEVEHNDECKELIHENEMKRLRKQDDIDNLGAKIGELHETIKGINARIEEAKTEINENQVALQKASEDRKAENLEFQKTITDQTMTISILHKAMEKLSKFYDAALVQKNVHTLHQTPPVAMPDYKPSSGAGGVMSMIEKLIYDAKEMVKETKAGESEAQASYEETVIESFDSAAALMKEVSTKTEENAENKKALLQAESDEKDAVADLERLEKTKVDIHGNCDYLMKNFNARQEARAAEMEVLLKEQEILSGASE